MKAETPHLFLSASHWNVSQDVRFETKRLPHGQKRVRMSQQVKLQKFNIIENGIWMVNFWRNINTYWERNTLLLLEKILFDGAFHTQIIIIYSKIKITTLLSSFFFCCEMFVPCHCILKGKKGKVLSKNTTKLKKRYCVQSSTSRCQ